LIKERAHFVSEFWEMSDFFFVAPTNYDEKGKNWKAETPALMQELICCGRNHRFTSMNRNDCKDWMTKTKLNGKSNATISFEFVGAEGPHLFDM
jgi:glutamyl-tRNA synthetase